MTANPMEGRRPEEVVGEDVEWLLQKKDHVPANNDKVPAKNGTMSPPAPQIIHNEPTPPQSPIEPSAPAGRFVDEDLAPHEKPAAAPPPPPTSVPPEAKLPSSIPTTAPAQPQSHPVRPPLGPKGSSVEDSKNPVKNLKKENQGRRSSWITSLSSKFSNSPQRSGSADSQTKLTSSPQPSPKVELTNPFNKTPMKDPKENKEVKKEIPEPPKVLTPRRQSVLVAAGKETKLDSPGFLSSALRRLSSSTNTTMGKEAGRGAICPRKVMNVDQNRERVTIQEFDQNKLRRVSFCVDVEIAGYAAQGDEEPGPAIRPPLSGAGQRGSLSAPSGMGSTKDAKYKEKGEGAALKNPETLTSEKEEHGEPKIDTAAAKAQAAEQDKENIKEDAKDEEGPSKSQPPPTAPPTTRKKEKKKRSEAERKERRERKRKHAEQNGLVPLELTINSDDSDSSPNVTPAGASTPRNGASPTTDPLRIYKRCCQLRETTVLPRVKEQISKPAAVLAEAPGTVAVIDLSGLQMQLQDVTTLGDWLAIVPVRKLMLDNCNLSDEGLRIILSGLSGCKSPEQVKSNKKLPRRLSGKSGREQMGVIEKLSLKNNTNITSLGWKHIALFLHLSHSLKAIDLSGIPFPRAGDLSRTSTASSGGNSTTTNGTSKTEVPALITRAIGERLGGKLEELILTSCDLSSSNISDLVDCALKCKISRLGLANNALTKEALGHIVRYITSGICEGLDLGNNNLHGNCHIISDAVNDQNPLFAISFSDCNLDTDDLGAILIPFQKLRNLKFIDLSHNHAMFRNSHEAVSIFRKLLPKLTSLKRIHLADCGLTSDHVIAVSEILPDCPVLAHVSLLENDLLVKAMNSKEGSAQEEACAFFASLMTAARVSETIVAIEIEVPSADSSEVVKALASQVVAYSLRNMERSTLDEFGLKSSGLPEKDAPEVLMHLVGHMDGYQENHDSDEPAPDEDYVIASSGIVKALGVCLETKDGNSRSQSTNISPTASGAATPKQGPLRPKTPKKPRDVSLELCESARKIRMRLRPALIKQDREGNDTEFRRLYFLDQTLQRMIQRFEDEYPETKLPPNDAPVSPPETSDLISLDSNLGDATNLSNSVESNHNLAHITSSEDNVDGQEAEAEREDYSIRLSRNSSNTSLAAKAYTDEEGRMHRFGQSVRREVLKPSGTDDYAHGTTANDEEEPDHLKALRNRLDQFEGAEIREQVEREGADKVIRDLGVSARELEILGQEEGGMRLEQRLAAQRNGER